MHTSPDRPTPGHKTRQVWTPEEDRLLREAVAKETPKHGSVSWHKVAACLPGRSNKDCRKRWHYSIANTIRKGTWMREEDQRLREAVELYGARWSKVAEAVGTRNGDQCWKRWYDCLDPRIDKSPWALEEDAKLVQLVTQQGRNWSDIVHHHFPNRTPLAAKNRYSILRRREQGPAAAARASSSSSSSSPHHHPLRHPKPSRSTASSSTPTPILSPSPFLSVPTTPSTTACATPEPEADAGLATQDWMALTEAEIDELLNQPFQTALAGGADVDWYAAIGGGGAEASAAAPSPSMVHDSEPWSEWTAGVSSGFGCGPAAAAAAADSLAPEDGAGYTSCHYFQGQQQQQLDISGYGYDVLGLWQGDARAQQQASQEVMYDSDTGNGLTVQWVKGIRGSWQGAYSMGGW